MSSSSLNDLLLSLTKQEFKEIIRETIQEEFQRMHAQNGRGVVVDELLTVSEAAEFLRVSVPTIYRYVQLSVIPVCKLKHSKRLYFSKEDLVNWVKTARKKTSSEIKEEADISILKK